jgi:uncharacterized membrane protein YkoI
MEDEMSAMKTIRNRRARAALVAALGLLLGGSIAGVTSAQAQARSHAAAEQKAPYKSSIQVPDDDREKGTEADEAGEQGEQNEKGEKGEGKEADEAGEKGEATSPQEQAESARYQKLARITAAQASAAALANTPGTATSVELENEDGNLVYGVTVKTAAGERDVKVDAGNGKVLHVEQDEQD